MATFNIELNSKPIKGSNKRDIMLRITVNRKHIRLNLMYSATPNQFNKTRNSKKYIRPSHPDHATINTYIEDKILQAKDVVAKLEKEGKTITPEIIRTKILQPKTLDLS